MKTLLKAEEARKLVTGSKERQQELIEIMNTQIQEQASMGLRYTNLPNSLLTEDEENWLTDRLMENGFIVKNNPPQVNW